MPKPVVRRRPPPVPDLKVPPPEATPPSDLAQARERKRREDELRAEGKPTLSASLGDLLRVRGIAPGGVKP